MVSVKVVDVVPVAAVNDGPNGGGGGGGYARGMSVDCAMIRLVNPWVGCYFQIVTTQGWMLWIQLDLVRHVYLLIKSRDYNYNDLLSW